MKKGVIGFVFVMLFFVLLGSTSVSAKEDDSVPSENETANDVLENSLEALVNYDIETYVENAEIKWSDSKSETIKELRSLQESLPLVNYEILEEEKISDHHYTFQVRTYYGEDRETDIFEEPFQVMDIDGKWKILMSEEGLSLDEYELVETKHEEVETKHELEENENDLIGEIQFGALCRSFNGEFKYNLSTSWFSACKSTGLILNITSQSVSSGGAVRYDLQGKYSNGSIKTLNTKTIKGNVKNTLYSLGYSGNKPSQLRLRFTHVQGFNASYPATVKGQLYF
ncbi:hypothetical protein AX282_06120 [Bacillus spizizenii]|uniref:hypothetical protein n=1 Tax=Bacillus spizizenii TaxID=96241 RepID=UPI0007726554|nr:hypothetical protein [Bacillus spizizenii]KXJ35297.1 hypothetical protein AX282_06120 [Bacillus spizizenii]